MRALITRPRENAGPIARALAERDVDVLLEPLLEIGPTEHDPIDLTGVQAVLVTSMFGVRELAKSTSERDVPVYAVGDATAGAAREAGFTAVESARGDAQALSDLVKSRLEPATGALLYAAGRTTAGDFPDQLAEVGFEIRRVELYAAKPAAGLSIEAVEALRNGNLDLALFFSPRTAGTFVRLVEEAGLASACGDVSALCLSAAVAEALQPLSWRSIEVAAEPNHEAMITLAGDWIERQRRAADDRAGETAATAAEPPAPRAEAAGAASPSEPPRQAPPVPPPARRSGLGAAASAMTILLLLLLLGGGVYLWRQQTRLAEQVAAGSRPVNEEPAFGALQNQVAALQARSAEDAAAIERRLTARVAELERRVQEIADSARATEDQTAAGEAPAASEAAQPTTPDLTPRLESLGQDVQALTERLGGLEQSLRQELQGLTTRLGETEQSLRAENKDVADRLAALARTTTALEPRLAEVSQQARSGLETLEQRVVALDKAARQAANGTAALLLAAGQTRSALEEGEPFAATLAPLDRLAAQDQQVAQALSGWADRRDQGIPTVETLRGQFAEIASAAVPNVQPDTGQSWLDRAIGRASSVVRIRRTGDDLPGTTPAALIGRAEAALEREDLPQAVRETEALPADVKARFAEWLAAAKARLRAYEGLAAIERMAVERTGGG